MSKVDLRIDGDPLPLLHRLVVDKVDGLREAAQTALSEAVGNVKVAAAADMRAGGRFGSRWTSGLQAAISEDEDSLQAEFTHDVPYFSVFLYGATIRGRPLLWLPLSFASDAQGVNARDYPGQLFRVDRKGGKAPLLMTAGKPAQAKYVGKESVTIPQKFHTLDIAREEAAKIPDTFKAEVTEG